MPYPWTLDSPDAPTHRMVDGVSIELSLEEKVQTVFEWNQNYEFSHRVPAAEIRMLPTDSLMPRLSEDTIVALLKKGVLTASDFVPDAWEKLNYRRKLRGELPL